MSKFDIHKVFTTAKTEYVKWICNARMILVAVIVIFINSFVIQPLQEHAVKMNSPLNVLEPFIATVNSEVLVIIVPAVFLALFSDFPRMDGNTLFFVHRVDKLNWVMGQVVFALYGIFTYVAVLFLGSVLPVITTSFWGNGWSLVVTDYSIKFPNDSQSFACLLLKNNIFNQVSPWCAAVQGYLLMMLYLLVLTLIMLVFSCLDKKTYGMLLAACVIAFGGTMSLVKLPVMWVLPMAHSSIWMHFTSYYRKPIVALWESYAYFIGILIVLLFVILKKIKDKDFDSIQEID